MSQTKRQLPRAEAIVLLGIYTALNGQNMIDVGDIEDALAWVGEFVPEVRTLLTALEDKHLIVKAQTADLAYFLTQTGYVVAGMLLAQRQRYND